MLLHPLLSLFYALKMQNAYERLHSCCAAILFLIYIHFRFWFYFLTTVPVKCSMLRFTLKHGFPAKSVWLLHPQSSILPPAIGL